MGKRNISKSVEEFLSNLKKDELEAIFSPNSIEETSFSKNFELEIEEEIEDDLGKIKKQANSVSAILHGRIKRTCYVVYAKFQYHAWVTLQGKRYKVDKISAKMNSGVGDFKKTKNNTSELKKTDEVYEYGNACRSAKMIVSAYKGNASATVRVNLK